MKGFKVEDPQEIASKILACDEKYCSLLFLENMQKLLPTPEQVRSAFPAGPLILGRELTERTSDRSASSTPTSPIPRPSFCCFTRPTVCLSTSSRFPDWTRESTVSYTEPSSKNGSQQWKRCA